MAHILIADDQEKIRPMLKSWLDANLEEIVRDVVEVEIKKITQA